MFLKKWFRYNHFFNSFNLNIWEHNCTENLFYMGIRVKLGLFKIPVSLISLLIHKTQDLVWLFLVRKVLGLLCIPPLKALVVSSDHGQRFKPIGLQLLFPQALQHPEAPEGANRQQRVKVIECVGWGLYWNRLSLGWCGREGHSPC